MFDQDIALSFKPRPVGKNGQGRMGYTTARRWLKNYKQMLAAHRRSKRTWPGSPEDFVDRERTLVGYVRFYRDLLREPYYVEKLRKAYNRKRRKPRSWKIKRSGNLIADLLARRELDREEKSYLRDKLRFLALQIKRKSFKNRQALANRYKQKPPWVADVLQALVNLRLISKSQLKAGFRRRGRPHKGKLRGPYKQRQNTGQRIAPNYLENKPNNVQQ
jgi:hypothetical protein